MSDRPPLSNPQPPPRSGASDWVPVLRVLGGLGVITLVVVGATSVASSFSTRRETVRTTVTEPVSTVVVDNAVGQVNIEVGPQPQVEVVRRTVSSWRQPGADQRVVGDRLVLSSECGGGAWFNQCQTTFDVTVPAGTDLDLSTSTGRITVRGETGRIEADTSTGAVDLTELTASHVDAHTSTGRVSVEFARPPDDVVAETSTGAVEVVVPDDGTSYAVDVSTSVGEQSVDVPQDPGSERTISARTSVGRVEVRVADSRDR